MKRMLQFYYDAEAGAGSAQAEQQTTPPPAAPPEPKEERTSKPDPDAYWQTEARKAFTDRDRYKTELRQLKEEREAKEAAERENKLKAEGQWEAIRQSMVEKQDKENKKHEERFNRLYQRHLNTVKRAEFGRATELFGGDSARTIFDVDMAIKQFGDYVAIEHANDDDDSDDYRVVVRKPNGDVILGDDGRPAPFTAAMEELIAALPNRDRIWRGSGKSGSGSAGGESHAGKPPDLVELTRRVQAGDPKAIAALKQRQADSGQMTFGRRPR